MPPLFFNIYIFRCCILSIMSVSVFSPIYANAEPTHITLLQTQELLSYPDEVRLSKVLDDGYGKTRYKIYPLGTALIDPHKQYIIDEKLHGVIMQLEQLNTIDSHRLIKQLNALRFVYRENINTTLSDVRVNPKLDPMLKTEYWLSLPKKPDHILIINPKEDASIIRPIQPNSDLKYYLSSLHTLNNADIPDSVWIIQADQNVYQVKGISWKAERFFLAPGAVVFTSLNNLNSEERDLNSDIAHLLAFRLEP